MYAPNFVQGSGMTDTKKDSKKMISLLQVQRDALEEQLFQKGFYKIHRLPFHEPFFFAAMLCHLAFNALFFRLHQGV
jgi:hypothetical protein